MALHKFTYLLTYLLLTTASAHALNDNPQFMQFFPVLWFQPLPTLVQNPFQKYKLLRPRGTQTCALAVANIKVNGNGKVILDTHPESDQHQN